MAVEHDMFIDDTYSWYIYELYRWIVLFKVKTAKWTMTTAKTTPV